MIQEFISARGEQQKSGASAGIRVRRRSHSFITGLKGRANERRLPDVNCTETAVFHALIHLEGLVTEA